MDTQPSISDEVLLTRMRQDDAKAFSLIYDRYWEGLFITAIKALRGREEAEDVVQDVFLSLWNRRQELDIRESLGAYLQTSIRYKAIHYIEKNITRRDYLALLTEASVDHLPAMAELQLALKEVQSTIQEVIGAMPPKMREVYELSRQEQLTHKEIAERLGISPETVKKHIQHALQLIRNRLSDHSATLLILLPYLVF